MIFDLYSVFSMFPVNLAHNLIGSFSRWLFFCVTCFYSCCHQTNQNISMMILTSTVCFISDVFSLYYISFFWIYYNCYYLTNWISLIMSLTMIGLTLGLLLHAIFFFTLMNPLVLLETPLVVLRITLVVFVVFGLEFLS